MKNRIKILLLSLVTLAGVSCNMLDRVPLTTAMDDVYWSTEDAVRLYANGFYENYFVGYGSGWSTAYSPVRGYNFSDDFATSGTQSNFENIVPNSRISTSTSAVMLGNYGSTSWNFSYVRKVNIMLARMESNMKEILTSEQYNHWTAVAKFFRGLEYSRLVETFGDVPYYDVELLETDKDLLYKDRDDRTVVMDAVAEDFKFALANMRASDINKQYLNKYIAASFISRAMLFEASWQKYHLNNTAKAKEYFELAVTAAEVVMKSGKYKFSSVFSSLFGSENLASNEEVILYREFVAALGVNHGFASYSNGFEGMAQGGNLDLIKSFICNDGNVYQNSTAANATSFEIKDLALTRDPRFESTFYYKPNFKAPTMLYANKFIARAGVTPDPGKAPADQYTSLLNVNDGPVIRYAEVVLNWIEAKAELAEMGGAAVSQDDLDKSVNAIRNRPLDSEAILKGVTKTAPLTLAALPTDPDRDSDVPALLWEIRRERRMEFVFEFARILDLRRWKKLEYMQGSTNKDILLGPWVNISVDMPTWVDPNEDTSKEKIGVLKVQKADGTVVTYDGKNAADLVGFYVPQKVADRNAITEKNYLAPVGAAQVSDYKDRGYTLTQTKGW